VFWKLLKNGEWEVIIWDSNEKGWTDQNKEEPQWAYIETLFGTSA
jgi:hypothetical protein